MRRLICYILNNVILVVLYSSPKVSTKSKLERITGVMCIEKGSKTTLEGDLEGEHCF